MSITWTVPSALWLLLAVPLVWIALRSGRTNFNPRQQRVQAVVRSLLLVALACALARPVISLGSSRLSVVYLVDASHSVSGRALTDAAARIDALLEDQPLTVPGYGWLSTVRVSRIRLPSELDPSDKSIRWQHHGGRYRVQVAPSV